VISRAACLELFTRCRVRGIVKGSSPPLAEAPRRSKGKRHGVGARVAGRITTRNKERGKELAPAQLVW